MSLYEEYVKKLLENGFTEAPKQEDCFYRKTTDKTAFVLNLKDWKESVWVMYGFALSSFMGDETWFLEHGSEEDTCKIRTATLISNKKEDLAAQEEIEAFYHIYCELQEEELVAAAKEKQKAFLNHFSIVLKPLGFKKKAAKWYKQLIGEIQLILEAQKSQYSDQYYFNVLVFRESEGIYRPFRFERVVMYGREIYNWQLMTQEQIDNLIQHTLDHYLLPILEEYKTEK